jgi:hypothetical protein
MTNGDDADNELAGYSHEKANNGPGQNGDTSASSDLPNQHTTSGFLPQTVLPARVSDEKDKVAGRVKTDASGKVIEYPNAHGLSARSVDNGSPGGTVPKSLNYPDTRK